MIESFRPALKDILDDVRARPARAGLALLALGVGMTALTVLLAVLGGLQQRARLIVEELGAEVFAISQAQHTGAAPRAARLNATHVDLLEAQLAGGVISGIQLVDGVDMGGDRQVRVVATDAHLLNIRPWTISSGRFLDEHDLHNRERVAVAEEALAREAGWSVGDTIRLREIPFRLVGLLRVGGDALAAESTDPTLSPGERAVFVPRTLPPYWQFSAPELVAPLDAIYVRAPSGRSLEKTVALARALLTQPDQRLEQLSFLTPDVLLQRLRKLQDTIRFTAGSIALLCLVLGGTTLMSLLVANVRERVTEIGLRRALGATPIDIAGLFVLEAVLLTGLAAVVGSFGTGALLWLARERFPIPLRLDAVVLLAPLITASLLGAAFSFWPARAAARISPAEALRNE